MEINNKLGQSGSNVRIISVGTVNKEFLVKKTSNESRFIHQYKKHLEAQQKLRMFPIKVPEIKENFFNNSYSMQYVLSENLGEYMLKHNTLLVQEIIINYLNNSIGENNLTSSSKNELINYFENKVRLNTKLGHIKNFNIDRLLCRFSDSIKSSKVTEGWNHGDFSFENILVPRDGENVYVIDFLDSPVNTPLIDLGRIYLDLSLGWWNSNKKINESNSQILNFKLKIENLAVKKDIDLDVIQLFALFACVRILPYTKNPIRLGFLKSYFHEMMKE